jgi:CMP-N,N'-diacetyllegionaminic acid synthase
VLEKNSILAIVPARGGSKRLPRKNMLDLAGKPLIEWTLGAALESKYIDRTVVSTDDAEIASFSIASGVEVPFLRPSEISDDTATTFDVVRHALRFFAERGEKYQYCLILQPTSPLRTAYDIDQVVEQIISRGDDAVVSVAEVDHSPSWCNTLDVDLSMVGFVPRELCSARSQDLPTYYRLNGAIYMIETSKLLGNCSEWWLFKEKVSAYIMDRRRSIDIDDGLDLEIADALLRSSQFQIE